MWVYASSSGLILTVSSEGHPRPNFMDMIAPDLMFFVLFFPCTQEVLFRALKVFRHLVILCPDDVGSGC